jgi:hypothetical protein
VVKLTKNSLLKVKALYIWLDEYMLSGTTIWGLSQNAAPDLSWTALPILLHSHDILQTIPCILGTPKKLNTMKVSQIFVIFISGKNSSI